MKESDWQLFWLTFSWLVLPFMVALSFYVVFRKCEKQFESNCYNFFATISFALLQSSCFNFYVQVRSCCLTLFTQMPSLNRNEKVTCDNCGTQTTKLNLARHKKWCSVGTMYCTQCPNFSAQSQSDLYYHIAKKHSAPKPDVTFKCKLCYQEFPEFYSLRQPRNTQQGTQTGLRASNIEVVEIVGDVDDQRLREDLESC